MTVFSVYILLGKEKVRINQSFHDVPEALQRSARISFSLGFSEIVMKNTDDMLIDGNLVYGCVISCSKNPKMRIFIENLIIENLDEEKPAVDLDKIRAKDFIMSKSLSDENN